MISLGIRAMEGLPFKGEGLNAFFIPDNSPELRDEKSELSEGTCLSLLDPLNSWRY